MEPSPLRSSLHWVKIFSSWRASMGLVTLNARVWCRKCENSMKLMWNDVPPPTAL